MSYRVVYLKTSDPDVWHLSSRHWNTRDEADAYAASIDATRRPLVVKDELVPLIPQNTETLDVLAAVFGPPAIVADAAAYLANDAPAESPAAIPTGFLYRYSARISTNENHPLAPKVDSSRLEGPFESEGQALEWARVALGSSSLQEVICLSHRVEFCEACSLHGWNIKHRQMTADEITANRTAFNWQG